MTEDLIKYSNQLIDSQSEELIIEEAKKNPQKFEPIYKKYYKPLFRMVINKTRDPDITGELLSNVFFKALKGIQKFDYKGKSIYFWLYRIALNECAEYFRKTGKVKYLVIDESMTSILKEEFNLESSDRMQDLKNALKKIKSKDLQIIELRFFDELKFKEMAEVLGCDEGKVKMRMYRAIKKLKNIIGYEI
ncbi:RNA polymerase sigma factor [Marinigracilibium pacificum]|uniref:Sigma-70 family RNA polymerase sigma factor n=1 Tax=Marinigracilibium pacificum TaxID=2729599 RepID=A0A848IZX6_9BACT|nr:sigma-70 family RNA polymerase sigma factor [Marinigracilibium pacificum]NMM47774.1 sigma-70 family RNA polymerase sigma factor [Marinigracilibium pacificum]